MGWNQFSLPPVEERFWAKVRKTHGCWLWTGCRKKSGMGYGVIGDNYETKYVHRVSYELHHGPIPKGYVVRHTCDVPLCVCPAHLVLGTTAENLEDCRTKGRDAVGEQLRHKLTESQVRAIRRVYRFGMGPSLAKRHNVDVETIRRVTRRESWRHVA